VAASWLGRIGELRALVDEVAPASWADPRWWALVSTIAAAETRRADGAYLLSDAGPATDTFMAWPAPRPRDPIGEAIALARAARTAIAELDGALIDQPLAGTIAIDAGGARMVPVALDAVAVAAGSRVAIAPLAATDAALVAAIAHLLAHGTVVAPLVPRDRDRARAFCTISLGDEAWPTARHGHRRGWADLAPGAPGTGGPWLGLARAGDHLLASTCHYAIDGHGHALLAARIAQTVAATPAPSPAPSADPAVLPPLADVPGVAPLALAWRAWPGPARAIPIAYRLGTILGAELGIRRGKSPSIQIPVSPGDRDDPDRWRRRVLPALVSVRFADGVPEPPAVFAARARAAIAREADRKGLASRVLAAGRALPMPLRWKRRIAASPGGSSPWIAPLFDALAGRGCVSMLRLPPWGETPLVAASGPSRTDATGSVVVTLVDSGAAGTTVAVSGTGRWDSDVACARLIDQLLDRIKIDAWTPGDES
jgi:hypothetical protein